MTIGSEFLKTNRKQVQNYNQIRKEVKNLIEANSTYKLKNIYYDGLHEDDIAPSYFAWFVELMDYSISLELITLLHNYFGGNCFISTSNTITHGGITVIFSYSNIEYVEQNLKEEVIE